jgi:hypothetical protein
LGFSSTTSPREPHRVPTSERRGARSVHCIGHNVEPIAKKMAVLVECHHRGFVAEHLLNELDIRTACDSQRRGRADDGEFSSAAGEDRELGNGRWVNLDQFLDGTYDPPQLSIGAERDDGIQFLYSGMWHTNIALTTAGKTTFGLWQAKSVLAGGGHVVYIHFEEASPNGIIHRLRGLGVDIEVIRKQFHWGHVDTPWQWGKWRPRSSD